MKFDVIAKYDVVVIGSGISGLLCALDLAKQNKSVLIISKEAITESSSQYAQGGIAIPLSKFDSVESHLKDTLVAGSGLCNESVAKEIINHAAFALDELLSYGVKFDLSNENNIHQTKEGAHSAPRVCHAGGDASGRYITKALIEKVCRDPRISISQGTFALNIVVDEITNSFAVLLEDINKNKYVVFSRDIVIATGGIGQIYDKTSNPCVCTADGVALAYNLGAQLQDVEMVQFHPTVLLEKGDPLLITEAIRGEGGKLKNVFGEYFAFKYHEKGELAPRDVLARAILHEMEITKSRYVYLDVNLFSEEYFKNRFPTIYHSCIQRKINLFNTGIPVAPAAHYFIGGIKCNISGVTSVPGLWAVGEVASNGFHGANRLASNSLLECAVVPTFLVKELLEKRQNIILPDYSTFEINVDKQIYDEEEVNCYRKELQYKNSQNLGLVRSALTLKEHLDWLLGLTEKFNVSLPTVDYQAQELRNMLLISLLICQAALERKHSLGVHFRQDFQKTPIEFKHSVFRANKQLSWEVESPKRELIPILD